MKDFDKIKRAMQCFKELNIKVEEADDETYSNQVGKRVVIDGWVSLIPLEVEETVRTIAGNRKYKVIGWDVEVLVHYAGSWEEPPEDDYTTVGENLTLEKACKKAWEVITANNVEAIFENIGYEEIGDEETYVNN